MSDPASTRQDEILDRTIELLREAGLAGLTMKKVAERVGFTEPAIYRHFPNKQALLAGVAGRLSRLFLGPVRAIAEETDTPPLDRIERIVAHHVGLIVDTDGIPILLLAEATASGEGELGRKMAEIAGTYLEIVGGLAAEIPQPPGSPPAEVAVLPVLGLAAAVALERRMLSERRLNRETAIELARYVVRRLLGPGVRVLLLLALLLPHAATAQDPLALPAAVDRALARFPGVEAARARQEEAAEALGEARAARRPRGRLTGSAIQYEEPMVVTPIHGFGPGLFPEFDETIGQATLTVSYTLFDSGADAARIRSADAQTLAAGAALGGSGQVLARRVAAAYLTVLGQRQVLDAHDLRRKALEAELSRVRQRFEVGRAARLEILRAEAALASSEAERVRLSSAMDNAERELARLLDLPVEETRSDRLVPVELADPRAPLREELAAEGIAASPAVAQARAQAAAAEAQIALARAVARPELRAVGNYNEWTSSRGDFTGEWNAGLQLTVPLFDGGATRRRIARAEAAHRAAQEQVRVAELQVREDVDRAAAALDEAEARIASLGTAVERFAEVARVQKLLLDEGAGTQTDWLTSEADLLAARASLADARHAAVLARVDLARAAGRLTPDWLRENLR